MLPDWHQIKLIGLKSLMINNNKFSNNIIMKGQRSVRNDQFHFHFLCYGFSFYLKYLIESILFWILNVLLLVVCVSFFHLFICCRIGLCLLNPLRHAFHALRPLDVADRVPLWFCPREHECRPWLAHANCLTSKILGCWEEDGKC